MTKLRLVAHPLFSDVLTRALSDRYEIGEPADITLMHQGFVGAPPDTKMIVLGHTTPVLADLLSMIESGACAFVPVTAKLDTLSSIIDLVMDGHVVWPTEVLEGLRQRPFRPDPIMLPPPPLELPLTDTGYQPRLSPREALLAKHLCDGLSNKHIARQTGIAEATVKVHVKAILRKLRVQNRTQAAVWLMNNTLESNQ